MLEGYTLGKNRFSTIDLNLLRIFKVLVEEKNTRRASERLHVSQPAISQSLQKLRHHFQDQLFVTVKTGLEPTPFADNLAEELMPHLQGLEDVINQSESFVASKLEGEITIALSSSFVFCLSGKLYRYFKEKAPNLTLRVVSWSDKTLELIEKDEILLGVNSELDQQPKSISYRMISRINSAALVRTNHPVLSDQPVGLKTLSKYPLARLLVSDYSRKLNPVVESFKQHGYELEVGFSSEHPSTLVDVVRHSDMFMATPDFFPIDEHPGVAIIKQQENQDKLSFNVNCYFHKRHTNSALIQWLNECLRYLFTDSSP